MLHAAKLMDADAGLTAKTPRAQVLKRLKDGVTLSWRTSDNVNHDQHDFKQQPREFGGYAPPIVAPAPAPAPADEPAPSQPAAVTPAAAAAPTAQPVAAAVAPAPAAPPAAPPVTPPVAPPVVAPASAQRRAAAARALARGDSHTATQQQYVDRVTAAAKPGDLAGATPERLKNVQSNWRITHRNDVLQALADGKVVPPNVLADYPKFAAAVSGGTLPELLRDMVVEL